VEVTRRFEVERYRTVWQMTSTVEGRLREGVGLDGILAALFPCGSVTGAPKISTMARIAELEISPREVYCGAIGLARPGGRLEFSVPIRTLCLDRETGEARYGTGGGIVWDSTPDAEYDELLAKSIVVREPWPAFELIETMAARDGRIPRLERHLERLGASAGHFGFAFPEAKLRAALHAAAAAGSPRRVRIALAEDGSFRLDQEPLGLTGGDSPDRAGEAQPARVAGRPVRSTDRFLFHKTTNRAAYERAAADLDHAFDVLLWNERGEATEFTRGNLVVELGDRLVTPPVAAGLLAGCYRAELLDAGTVAEHAVSLDAVLAARRAWFVNSARGWIRVEISRSEPRPRSSR
jgi:para-aminobenzoate synthetase / 4-amino-4-deoxychorismate lyase